MAKFIKYILLVLVGFIICDFSVSFVIERLMKNRYNPIIYSTYVTQSDIAILGASRAAHHYVPRLIEDSLHMTVTNYGIDGHNIFTQYVVLNSLLEHSKNKPKIVILEISAIDVNDTPKWNTEKLSLLYPYYRSEKYVRDILGDLLEPSELFAVQCFGLYRHNSNYISYAKYLITGFPDCSDGYKPLNGIWDKPIEEEEESNPAINDKKMEYVAKFISLCKKENIKLILAVSPNYKKFSGHKWAKKVAEIAENNDIPFLYHEMDTIYHIHPEWFNEPFHLNDKGARFYTEEFCNELKALID